MLLYKYKVYLFLVLLASCSSDQKNFSFSVDFQSGSLFKSQALFLNNLSKTKSKGQVKKVNFGDPKMSIKKDQPARKKSYCARSGGIKGKTSKLSANYWSRKAWDC